MKTPMMTVRIECETLEELVDYLVKMKVLKDDTTQKKSATLEPEEQHVEPEAQSTLFNLD